MKNSEFISYEIVEMETILANDNDKKNILTTVIESAIRPKYLRANYYTFIYVVSGQMSFTYHLNNTIKNVIFHSGDGLLFDYETKLENIATLNCTFRLIYVWENFFNNCCNFISNTFLADLKSREFPILFSLNLEKMLCFELSLEQFINTTCVETQIQLSKGIIVFLLNQTINIDIENYSTYPAIVKTILSILNFIPNILDGIPPQIYDLGYSKNYICRIFKKHVGMSITNYITDRKIKHSISIFNQKNVSIAEVCDELHIESIPYFTKIFKQKYGITPAKYRNNISR